MPIYDATIIVEWAVRIEAESAEAAHDIAHANKHNYQAEGEQVGEPSVAHVRRVNG